MGALPTFIVIGAMKCGTSSLHQYLDEHPQVCVSNPKETDFFLKRNEKDLAWYRGCFEGEAKAYGEVAPNYTKHPGFPGVPRRMNDLLPNVKLIYLVRDPIERAVSHYVHNWVKRRVTVPIDQAFQPVEESGYLNTSRYYFQLIQYLEYYSMENILVVPTERLRRSREEVMADVFRFVGVDPHVARSNGAFAEEHNKTAGKERKTSVAAFLTESSLGRTLKNIGKGLVPQNVVEWTKEILWEDVRQPTPSREVLTEARKYLKEDIDQLRSLTGKEFPEWAV